MRKQTEWQERETETELDEYLDGDWSEKSLAKANEELQAFLDARLPRILQAIREDVDRDRLC